MAVPKRALSISISVELETPHIPLPCSRPDTALRIFEERLIGNTVRLQCLVQANIQLEVPTLSIKRDNNILAHL